MPITKRFNELQGLADIDVYFEEDGLNSNFFNITEFPEPLQSTALAQDIVLPLAL